MRSLLLTFALLHSSCVLAQSVGDYSITLRTATTGPQTLKSWPKANNTLWGTDEIGNPKSINLSGGLTLTGGTLTAAGAAWGTLTGDLTDQTDLQSALDAKQPTIGDGTLALAKLATDPLARTNHTGTQAWSTITSTPTTLGGYGITDALTATLADSTYQPIIADGTLALAKLDTDPLARANHTGTQDLGTTTTGTLSVTRGGTGATSAGAARSNLLPSKSGKPLQVLRVNAVTSDYELAPGGLPHGYLAGLILSPVAAPSNLMAVSVGACRDDTDTRDIILSTALASKHLTTFWSQGGTGGANMTGGSLASNTLYPIFAILNPNTGAVDVMLTNTLTPTLPSGFGYKRRIGWLRTLSVTNTAFVPWTQHGDMFILDNTAYVSGPDHSAAPTGPGVITLPAPPNVVAMLKASGVLAGSTAWFLNLDSTSSTAATPAPGLCTLSSVSAAVASAHVDILTDDSSQIAVSIAGAAPTVSITVRGWIDTRGKDD